MRTARLLALALAALVLLAAGTRDPVDTLRASPTFPFSNAGSDSTRLVFMVRYAEPTDAWLDSTDWSASTQGAGCDTMEVWLVPFHGGTPSRARMEGDSIMVLDRVPIVYDSAYTIDVRTVKDPLYPSTPWRGMALMFRSPQCGLVDSVFKDTLIFKGDTTIFWRRVEPVGRLSFDADVFDIE